MKKGFTLIELLIVVSIISLLTLLGIFLFKKQYDKGRDARRKADIHKIQEAAEEYEKDHDCYPQPELVYCQPGTGLTPYLSKVPCDIATGDKYYYENDNDNDTCAKWYRIFIYLNNLSDKDIIAGIGPGNAYNFYLGSPNAPVPTSESSFTPVPTVNPDQYYGCDSNRRCNPVAHPGCEPSYTSSDCSGMCDQPTFVPCQ